MQDAQERVRGTQEAVGSRRAPRQCRSGSRLPTRRVGSADPRSGDSRSRARRVVVEAPAIRARLVQDAELGDPIDELEVKIADQRTVTQNLATDLKAVNNMRRHLTTVIRQSRLCIMSAERGRTSFIEGRLVRQPADEDEVRERRERLAGYQATDESLREVADTLEAQVARAAERLDLLERALPPD